MKNDKVFISGKISGLPKAQAYSKFEDAEKYLRYVGFTNIFNPMKEIDQDLPYEKQMQICLQEVQERDRIYLLENWIDSDGSKLEVIKAITLNKKISCFSSLSQELRQSQY